MRADLAALVAKRQPCACGQPRVFGDRCRPCFVERPLEAQIADLERLVIEAEEANDFPTFSRYLAAYENVVRATWGDEQP